MQAYDTVELRGIVKSYGPTRALGPLDARFERGQCTVVEGPNGAGKSTLLNVLALLTPATRGQLFMGGLDARQHASAVRGSIGIVSHASMLYPDLTAREALALVASLHRIAASHVGTTADRFELQAFADRPVRTLSRGQLQRVALARALLASPTLLLLDEPSTGLDTASTDRLAAAVDEERARGAIVVVVTHDPAFAARVGTQRLALRRGRTSTREAS